MKASKIGNSVMLEATRKAINQIAVKSIQTDFLDLTTRAEYGINNGEPKLALACINSLGSMIINLKNSISQEASISLINGILIDANANGVKTVYKIKTSGRRCYGNRNCVRGGEWCFSGPDGCIGGGTPWPDADRLN